MKSNKNRRPLTPKIVADDEICARYCQFSIFFRISPGHLLTRRMREMRRTGTVSALGRQFFAGVILWRWRAAAQCGA